MFHTMNAYRDGHQWVPFCTVCSAENPPMGEECPGMKMNTEDYLITCKAIEWPKASAELEAKIMGKND